MEALTVLGVQVSAAVGRVHLLPRWTVGVSLQGNETPDLPSRASTHTSAQFVQKRPKRQRSRRAAEAHKRGREKERLRRDEKSQIPESLIPLAAKRHSGGVHSVPLQRGESIGSVEATPV